MRSAGSSPDILLFGSEETHNPSHQPTALSQVRRLPAPLHPRWPL